MATLWKHYTLRQLVGESGGGRIELLHGLRCSNCSTDFHCDRTPAFCPGCGESFIGEAHFGQRLPELQKIREDKIVAMLKEITLKTDEILSLAQQETQDIAALKAISQAVADKVRSAAQRMNDAIAALKAGTVNAQQLDAIASEMANHHNDLQALADALNTVGSTADAEQPPADPNAPPPAPTSDSPATSSPESSSSPSGESTNSSPSVDTTAEATSATAEAATGS
jgi:hypothetical protein